MCVCVHTYMYCVCVMHRSIHIPCGTTYDSNCLFEGQFIHIDTTFSFSKARTTQLPSLMT